MFMVSFKKNGIKYYTTKKAVLKIKRSGDRIYFSTKENAYYIKRPKQIKKFFWRF